MDETNSQSPYPLLERLLFEKSLQLKGVYTNKDAADMFGVSRRTIQEWIREGKVSARDLPDRSAIGCQRAFAHPGLRAGVSHFFAGTTRGLPRGSVLAPFLRMMRNPAWHRSEPADLSGVPQACRSSGHLAGDQPGC